MGDGVQIVGFADDVALVSTAKEPRKLKELVNRTLETIND